MASLAAIDIISTDVFDTLLLRNPDSQRSRILKGETIFTSILAQRGIVISAYLLLEVRLQVQRLAFRALGVGDAGRGEIGIVDVISRQFRVLGVPQDLIGERLRIELDVEKRALAPNVALGAFLQARRAAGTRIIAVSDTMLSADHVAELIRTCHGTDIADRIYTSADYGLTKRGAQLFDKVALAEGTLPGRIMHIGDDWVADVEAPLSRGLNSHHVRRANVHRHVRSADAAATEARRFIGGAGRGRDTRLAIADPHAFGRLVFGPILTQLSLLIWLYVVEAERLHDPVLLFCARGGVGIREAFERVLTRLALPLRTRRETLMVSRLVAARAALLTRSRSALEELDREFHNRTLAEAAQGLGGRPYDLPPSWQRSFTSGAFTALLFDEAGAEILSDLKGHDDLFQRHFSELIGLSDRVILCDTGLYGSTLRMLSQSHPDVSLEALHFARSNYKRHGDEHFRKLTGLFSEDDGYNPFNPYSCVLRFWHLIESLFEPRVPSVETFAEAPGGHVTANSGDLAYGTHPPLRYGELMSGALAYIDAVSIDRHAEVLRDAKDAWARLRRAIARPTAADLKNLTIGGRSVDFGRPDVVQPDQAGTRRDPIAKLASIKTQFWREGYIAREFPVLKHILWPMVEAALTARWAMRTTLG